jgi:hypothetical protein
MTRKERIIGISGAVAREMALMAAASITFIMIAEGINWACILGEVWKEK